MNTQTRSEELKNQFRFHGVIPDRELETKANLKLMQLLVLAPPGAYALASLEVSGKSFLASVTVHSAYRTFSSQAFGGSQVSAINRALQRLEDQLYRWRFGSGTRGSGGNKSESGVGLPWVRSS